MSGITEKDMEQAEPFHQVRAGVQELLNGRILVGHGLQNDLKCLDINHPWNMIRDTAAYEPFMKGFRGTLAPRKLKDLTKERIGREIQAFGVAHSPIEDAVAALDLYKSHRPRWEACIQAKLREVQRQLRQQYRQQQHVMRLQQMHEHQQYHEYNYVRQQQLQYATTYYHAAS